MSFLYRVYCIEVHSHIKFIEAETAQQAAEQYLSDVNTQSNIDEFTMIVFNEFSRKILKVKVFVETVVKTKSYLVGEI